MKYNLRSSIKLGILFLIAICFLPGKIHSQNKNIEEYQFISPIPNSDLLLPGTSIIIRQGEDIDNSTLSSHGLIEVQGSLGGDYPGDIILSDDNKTIIFVPDRTFSYGEEVRVKLNSGILTASGKKLKPINFTFNICKENSNRDELIKSFYSDLLYEKHNRSITKLVTETPDTLPADFPTITVTSYNNPSPGYLFSAPFIWGETFGYLIITDNMGIPIFYTRSLSLRADFKLQPNGYMTYWNYSMQKFYEMDSSYVIIDSYAVGNGYTTDLHELQILPSGHALLMAYDPQIVRMDTIVQGGDSAAIVWGLIIQELDVSKNVVFQWRSWDHFQITDATEDVDLTAHSIDYVHGNAIEMDNDGNLMISCRHMDEITKINRQTGDIVWRWGGAKSRNNQFQFVNDMRTFSHQHDIRRIPNGNVTLYDNGNLHIPQYSRALEYHLDEDNRIATLISDFHNTPESYFPAMGNTQRIPGGNTIVGWGWGRDNDMELLSEINPDALKELEFTIPDEYNNYRAFKFPWRTNLFTVNPDSIFFETVEVGDSATASFYLKNNAADSLQINDLFHMNSYFTLEAVFPLILPSQDSVLLNVKFKPGSEGYFKDVFHIRSETEASRVAQLLFVSGRTDSIFSYISEEVSPNEYQLEQNYPNPFNPVTTIKFSIPRRSLVKLIVHDLLGSEIAVLIDKELQSGTHSVEFNASDLASGIYFYRLRADSFSEAKKLIILK